MTPWRGHKKRGLTQAVDAFLNDPLCFHQGLAAGALAPLLQWIIPTPVLLFFGCLGFQRWVRNQMDIRRRSSCDIGVSGQFVCITDVNVHF